jgi:hypothetical protein
MAARDVSISIGSTGKGIREFHISDLKLEIR